MGTGLELIYALSCVWSELLLDEERSPKTLVFYREGRGGGRGCSCPPRPPTPLFLMSEAVIGHNVPLNEGGNEGFGGWQQRMCNPVKGL